jgi:hypothetical protein
MALRFPLVAWGAPDDISASPWISNGAPGVTPGQADPFGGTGAVLIDDDSAAGPELRRRDIAAFGLAAGFLMDASFIRQGTATKSTLLIRDDTVAANRIFWTATWSGGVPTLVVSAGVAFAPIAVGGGNYLVLSTTSAILAASAHSIRCYGADSLAGGSSDSVGSTYWYRRNVVLLDLIDDDKAWRQPGDGSERIRSPSGLFDRWLPAGFPYRFKGRVRWVPSVPRSIPTIVSGWEGANEVIGVNSGVQAMLKAGMEGQSLIWVPDRTLCSDNIASELEEPWEEEGYEHDGVGGDRAFGIKLRNMTRAYPTVL